MKRTVNIYRPAASPENIFIKQIWSAKDACPVQRTEKVLPQGIAELIFNLSGAVVYRSRAGEKDFKVPDYFINGLNFTPIDIKITDRQYFIGVQFHVFALKYLFGIPVAEFNDRIVEGSLICKSLDSLALRLRESDSFSEHVSLIMAWFSDKMMRVKSRGFNERIMGLHSDPAVTNLSVRGVSEKYNVCPRHLNRLCIDYFGVSPEQLVLYKKYLLALNQLHERENSLTEVAYTSGFYDQAHFNRTFKLFTSMSPGQYRKSAGSVPGHMLDFPEPKRQARLN